METMTTVRGKDFIVQVDGIPPLRVRTVRITDPAGDRVEARIVFYLHMHERGSDDFQELPSSEALEGKRLLLRVGNLGGVGYAYRIDRARVSVLAGARKRSVYGVMDLNLWAVRAIPFRG